METSLPRNITFTGKKRAFLYSVCVHSNHLSKERSPEKKQSIILNIFPFGLKLPRMVYSAF